MVAMFLERDYDFMLRVLDKAENGPIVDESDWDRVYVYNRLTELVKKYDVRLDKSTMVPDDDALADRVFEAGMELARESGVYCLDTDRRMVFSQDELDQALASAPLQVTIGEGDDLVTIVNRKPDEKGRVATNGGPYGTLIPEEQFIPLMLSYAQEPLIDIIDCATFVSTHGRPIRARSPWEAVACWQEAQYSFEVIRRAGRPGMAIGAAENGPSEIGELSSLTYGAYRPCDWHRASFVSELKVSYAELIKSIHFAHTGAFANVFYNPIYGGYVGGAEGMAVAIAAGIVLLKACLNGTTYNPGPSHAHLSCDTFPPMIPSQMVALQGLNRNTNLLTSAFVKPTGGPGTKDILYETAAYTLASVASGVSVMEGVQSATGRFAEHVSGLEARFMAQVTHASEGLTRREADPIVCQLVAKYEGNQKSMPAGKRFSEVYDLETVQPLPEWQRMYDDVCQEVEQLGLKL
jgi:methylamine--corrinoid protein Co-methyltransferase